LNDLAIAGAAIASIVVLILALGRWAGGVSSSLREIRDALRAQVDTVRGLGRKLDADRERNNAITTRLWMAHAESRGRIEKLELIAGMPPPWKRTQPIRPVDPAAPPPPELLDQDMFRKDDVD
jgi:hypothetical protein